MKYILLLFVLFPILSFADELWCSIEHYPGKFIGVINTEIAKFQINGGRQILFSFGACYVIRSKK